MADKTAHFPGRAQIDTYGNGGFRFAGMSHRGSIIALPGGISEWNPANGTDFRVDDFRLLEDEADKPEVLLIGTGASISFVEPEVRAYLRDMGIGIDFMDTGAAVGTYNILLAEDRSVGAALLAVD
ncbi:Mth938-like domain-containing protein [Tepidamorphus sp. 3E244]|uniref:Mth938-like domain-containing protein n=1 Tax=Tepidamorphus sp. 3E244 TaxID=3385498 RepID=UPI0038FD3C5F